MPSDFQAPSASPDDKRPVPDPTTLTTAALYREIAQLREYIAAVSDGDGKVTDEKFAKVTQQFELIERTRVELRIADQTALAAALAAQKESAHEQAIAFERATAKAEAATTKQLEQLTANFTTATAGLTGLINDLKERVGRIENTKAGGKEAVAGIYAFMGFVTTVAVFLGVLLAIKK